MEEEWHETLPPGDDDYTPPPLHTQQFRQPPPFYPWPNQQSFGPQPQRITLTPFWARDPQAWFRLAESSFARGNVRDPVHRFDLVLQALSEDTIEQVRDILRNADTLPNPYEAIKEELIRQLAPNVLEQLNGIVFAPELGGQPPSQLMKKLLSLLPAGEPPGLLFKHHFILRLPSDIRDQVAKKIQRLDAKMPTIAGTCGMPARCR